MITEETFKTFIKYYEDFSEGIERFDMSITGKSYPTILFETDWAEAVGKMLDIFLDSNFTDEGADLVAYYLWEDVEDKAVYIKQDKDIFDEEKEIRYPLDTLDGLWNFLITDKKLYFKNV